MQAKDRFFETKTGIAQHLTLHLSSQREWTHRALKRAEGNPQRQQQVNKVLVAALDELQKVVTRWETEDLRHAIDVEAREQDIIKGKLKGAKTQRKATRKSRSLR